MTVYESMPQGSEQWEKIRLGRATASEASKIITSTGKLSASRLKYMRKLARECVVNDPSEWMGNIHTDRGNELEPEAKARFSEITGLKTQDVGFCVQDNGVIGCSPDALIVGEDNQWAGGLEVKVPKVDAHVDYLMEGKLPTEYKVQVHWSMAVTGLPYWFFMSYHEELNPFILKVERDSFTEKVRKAQEDFIIEYSPERERVLKAIIPA